MDKEQYQTSIFPQIQQYIHDLSTTLNLSLIVLISSQISSKCSLPVYTQLKTDKQAAYSRKIVELLNVL